MMIRATDPRFNFYGRWYFDQDTAHTINSGSLVEFAYQGIDCRLLFDIERLIQFPAVFTQIDRGPVQRHTLSRDCDNLILKPEYTPGEGPPPYRMPASQYHLVRVWIAANSLYQTKEEGRGWTGLEGGCRFSGVLVPNGALVALPYQREQIEFLGDSITQGSRLLYTGQDKDTALQTPCTNWPQLTADLLGLKPVVTGFGGQGITVKGVQGAPPAAEAFPFAFQDAPYKVSAPPKVVVTYFGTNDQVSPEFFQVELTKYLHLVRETYPGAPIFAVCPHGKPKFARATQSAVSTLPNAIFLDYSQGIIAEQDTCDGCHLNPGGAVKLAIAIASDINRYLRDT